jgi:hypothetical protein
MTNKQPAEPLSVVYSIKLTQSQRIRLLQLGGPKWMREQIEKTKHEPKQTQSNERQ